MVRAQLFLTYLSLAAAACCLHTASAHRVNVNSTLLRSDGSEVGWLFTDTVHTGPTGFLNLTVSLNTKGVNSIDKIAVYEGILPATGPIEADITPYLAPSDLKTLQATGFLKAYFAWNLTLQQGFTHYPGVYYVMVTASPTKYTARGQMYQQFLPSAGQAFAKLTGDQILGGGDKNGWGTALIVSTTDLTTGLSTVRIDVNTNGLSNSNYTAVTIDKIGGNSVVDFSPAVNFTLFK